jgi:hypothetical protein
MALGLKRIETRHWSTNYRGLMAIHAAKRWTADEREFHAIEHEAGNMPATLPLGAIVAIGRLVDCRRTEALVHGLSEREEGWGNYGPNRFGWIFEDIAPLPEPIPFKGLQGLFDVPDEVLRPGCVVSTWLPEPKPAAPPPRQGALGL